MANLFLFVFLLFSMTTFLQLGVIIASFSIKYFILKVL